MQILFFMVLIGCFAIVVIRKLKAQQKKVKSLEAKVGEIERSQGVRNLDVALICSPIVDNALALVGNEDSRKRFAQYLLDNEEGLKEFTYGSVTFAIEKYGEVLTRGEFDYEVNKRAIFLAYAIGYGIEKEISLIDAVIKTNDILRERESA